MINILINYMLRQFIHTYPHQLGEAPLSPYQHVFQSLFLNAGFEDAKAVLNGIVIRTVCGPKYGGDFQFFIDIFHH